MPRYSSRGLDLAYHVSGEGPLLILLHGWAASAHQWEEEGWIDELGRKRRLVALDVIGHGDSAKPHDPQCYRTALLADDIMSLLDELGETEADLFGYSMGGTIALWTAILHPWRVRSLITGGLGGGQAAVDLGRAIRGLGPSSTRAERYRAYAESMPGSDLEALACCLESGLAPPPCSELSAFGGESLVVAGSADRRRELTEQIAGCLPGGRFLLVDGDHMGAFQNSRFHGSVIEFLDEVSPS